MSTSAPSVDFFNGHDYATHRFQPTASQHSPTSIQPAHKVTSGSTPKKSSKPPLGQKKTVWVEEQLSVKNEHHAGGGDTVGGSVETVGGASGVVLEGKRVRKPSQRARALQEEAQAKVRAPLSDLCVLITGKTPQGAPPLLYPQSVSFLCPLLSMTPPPHSNPSSS